LGRFFLASLQLKIGIYWPRFGNIKFLIIDIDLFLVDLLHIVSVSFLIQLAQLKENLTLENLMLFETGLPLQLHLLITWHLSLNLIIKSLRTVIAFSYCIFFNNTIINKNILSKIFPSAHQINDLSKDLSEFIQFLRFSLNECLWEEDSSVLLFA